MSLKTTYRGHTILTEALKNPEGGWSLTLQIFAPDGRPVVSGINLPDMTFATEILAHRAGVTLAQYWIDAQE